MRVQGEQMQRLLPQRLEKIKFARHIYWRPALDYADLSLRKIKNTLRITIAAPISIRTVITSPATKYPNATATIGFT